MNQYQIEALARGFAPVVHEYVADQFAKVIAPLVQRIVELEARLPIRGEKGEKGEVGSPGERGEAGPPGERGEDGKQGETGPQGEAGTMGPPGTQGEKGDKGDSGESIAGPQGERGEKGDPGSIGEKGDPGRDADPDEIARKMAEIVEAPLRTFATELVETKMMQALADIKVVNDHTIEDVQPLLTKMVDTTATPLVAKMVADAVAALPLPLAGEKGESGPAGEPGRDGTSVSIADVEPVLESLVTRAIADIDIPKPLDGKDGAPGRDGVDGVSPTPEDIAPIVKAVTTEILSEWPRPADGTPGNDGEPGAPGEKGERGEKGDPGVDGKDGRDGQPGVPGRDGKDGASGLNGMDGKDGLALSDLEVEQIDDRSLRVILASGDIVKSIEWKMPVPIYRGAFSAEKTYERGDEVNFGGQVYIAVKDEPQGRPGTSEDWQMRTRRGRDGRDGAQGSPGERGPQGPRGRDQWEKP